MKTERKRARHIHKRNDEGKETRPRRGRGGRREGAEELKTGTWQVHAHTHSQGGTHTHTERERDGRGTETRKKRG